VEEDCRVRRRGARHLQHRRDRELARQRGVEQRCAGDGGTGDRKGDRFGSGLLRLRSVEERPSGLCARRTHRAAALQICPAGERSPPPRQRSRPCMLAACTPRITPVLSLPVAAC
jgi:hypothetical protein